MLLWNISATDFAFHFYLVSIYQYREERNTGKIGKERGHLFEQRNGHTTGGYQLRSVLTALRAVLGLRHISAPRVRCAETSGSRKSLAATPNRRSPANTSMYLRERGKQKNRKNKKRNGRKDRDKNNIVWERISF